MQWHRREVRSFEFDSYWLEPFLDLPYRLHGGDALWIPPFRSAVRAELAVTNPFFAHGRLRHFLSLRNGDAVARSSAFIDEQHRDEGGRPVGMVGFLEFPDDDQEVERVLSPALDWLRSQGATTALAPMNFSIWHAYRFRTQAHQEPPFLGEPHNPPCYPQRIEAAGFEPVRHYMASHLGARQISEVEQRREPAFRRMVGQGFRFRSFRRRRFDEDFRLLYELVVDAYRAFLGWTPLSYAEFCFVYGGMRDFYDPRLINFAFEPGGQIAGYVIGLPDVGAAVQTMAGESDLRAKLRFLWHRRRVDRASLSNIGVTDAHRRTGLGSALAHLEHRAVREAGYQRAVIGLSALDNPSVSYGKDFDVERRYTLYRRDL